MLTSASIAFLMTAIVCFIMSETMKVIEDLILNYNTKPMKKTEVLLIILIPLLTFLGVVCTIGFFISLLV